MALVASVNLLVAALAEWSGLADWSGLAEWAGLAELAEPLAEPGLLGQPWFQPVMMLLCVAGASAWLTARWMIRRRSGCAGDCSRCTAHGAESHGPARTAGACGRPPGGGIRPDGLRVLQGRGAANVPPGTAV
jgi:hypothetical protein